MGLAGGVALSVQLRALWFADHIAGRGYWEIVLFASLVLVFIASIAVHTWILKYALAVEEHPERPRRRWGLEIFLALALFPMAAIHEDFVFGLFEGTAEEFSILALVIVLPTVFLFYLRVRMHYFINDPGNRSNSTSFGITVALMTLYAVLGIVLM